MKLTKYIFILLLLANINASEEVPTVAEVAKLYVATFNRAASAEELSYWTNDSFDSKPTLSKIAKSFFDQPEAKELYPESNSNESFVTSIYDNLFDRSPQTEGLDYWVSDLDTSSVSRDEMILAVINGATDSDSGDDATILENKTTVVLSYANEFQTVDSVNIVEAESIIADVSADASSVESALDGLEIELFTQYETNNLNIDIVNAIPTSELTLEQKATLAFMWDEERLARDIYLALNEITPSQTLYNIATRAETKHVESVENLIKKYDLNIFNSVDFTGGYDEEALASQNDREFITPDLTVLYDVLYTKGSQSLQDALEVGCMVEVTDINDLNRDIEIAGDALDIVTVFESLRSGSYSHYWGFDNALKAQGVSDGCCSLGDDFCKTVEEYPQSDHGSGNQDMQGSGH